MPKSAAGVPILGFISPMVQARPRVALLTCLGGQVAEHPPAPDGLGEAPFSNRSWRLCIIRRAAPRHGRVIFVSRGSGPKHPICGPRKVPGVPACGVLAKVPGGPRHKIWGAAGSDLLTRGWAWARLANACSGARHRGGISLHGQPRAALQPLSLRVPTRAVSVWISAGSPLPKQRFPR